MARAVVRYFPDSYYSMQADKALEEFARSTSLPTAMRLSYAYQSHMNRWGHCPFVPGELRALLGVSRDTLYTALKSLKSARVVAQESTIRCAVLNAEIYRRNDRATHLCTEDKHAGLQQCMWVKSAGWETAPGEWHGMINDPEARELHLKRTRTRTVTTTETVELTARVA